MPHEHKQIALFNWDICSFSSLNSLSAVKRIHASFPTSSAILIRESREALRGKSPICQHLLNWGHMIGYHSILWRAPETKNNFRGIAMGIGPVWEIHSLGPFILSWPPLWISCFFTKHNSLQVCSGTQNLDFMQKAYADCLFLFKALETIRKFH